MTTFRYATAAPAQPRQFHRIDLAAVTPELPELLLGVYYRGHVTAIFGPTGAGKTMLNQAIVLEAVRAGHEVAHFDEEMGAAPMAQRYRALGASVRELEKIAYYEWEAPGLEDSGAFVDEVRERSLVLIDPTTDALTAAGVDENDNSAYTEWSKLIPGKLTAEGISTILTDGSPHVDGGKARMRGASQKSYKAALVWRLEVIDELDRDHVGLIRLTCEKDRFGAVGRGASQAFRLGGDGRGGIVFERTGALRNEPSSEKAGNDRALLVGRVVAVLEQHAPAEGRAITQNQLCGLLGQSRLRDKTAACQEASDSPTVPVRAKPGPNRSLLYWHEALT
jgi:RecA/RadA recombinase